MGEVWERLREATHNDEALVAFLQQLLTVEPEPRSDFAKLVEGHPYLQPAIVPAAVSGNHAASLPAPPTPPLAVPRSPSPLLVAKDGPTVHGSSVEPVPGLPSVWWDPASPPVCRMASGAVYRYVTASPLQAGMHQTAVLCLPLSMSPCTLKLSSDDS